MNMGNSMVTPESIQEGTSFRYETWKRGGTTELWMVRTEANGWEQWWFGPKYFTTNPSCAQRLADHQCVALVTINLCSQGKKPTSTSRRTTRNCSLQAWTIWSEWYMQLMVLTLTESGEQWWCSGRLWKSHQTLQGLKCANGGLELEELWFYVQSSL